MKSTEPDVQSTSTPLMIKNGHDSNGIKMTGSSIFYGQFPELKIAHRAKCCRNADSNSENKSTGSPHFLIECARR